jgi:hypothetical protein
MAGASWELVCVDDTPPGFAPVATGAVEVGAAMPLVKGTPAVPVPAPVNAGWFPPVGLGAAVVLEGFKTLPLSDKQVKPGGATTRTCQEHARRHC